MEVRDALYIIFGYLLGSILFARLGGLIFKKTDIMAESPDKNPGTMNAFTYGGFRCGVFTLCGDLLKGFFPVFLYRSGELPENPLMLSFVMAAPILGHILPFYDIKHGGKGIAATYILAAICTVWLEPNRYIVFGFLLIAASVLAKLFMSAEEKEHFEVKLAWKH